MKEWLWAIYWTIRGPHLPVPPPQWLDRAEHDGGVIPLRPFNRPLWPEKPFHCKPFVKTMRVFFFLRRKYVSWDDLLDLYERYRKEQYG